MRRRAPPSARVVHVSSVHEWDDSRILRRECVSLSRAGYEVLLLAVAEEEHLVEGVHVLPVPSATGRAARLGALPRVARRALALRAGLYHLHDPELIPLLPVLRARGARVVYDAHEDLPLQILEKEYLPARLRPAVALAGRLLSRVAGRYADHVIAASTTVAERFDPARCTVVRNFPEVVPGITGAVGGRRRPRIVYAGGLTRARGAEQMVDAMALSTLPARWRLLLVGPHSPDDFVERLSRRPGWARVDHSERVPPNEARRMMAECSVGLALLQPIGQNVDVQPTKLFEYMSLGLPVIASDYPACREVVAVAGCGLLVDPTDPRAIARAVDELAGDPARAAEMGERGRRAAFRDFSWHGEEQRLLGVYARLLPGAGRPTTRAPGSSAAS